VSARELAGQFEVSKRTIYRDVDELSAAGVPIFAERGAAGGFALLDGWRTRLTGMTPAEAEALIFAGLPATAADLGVGADAATARLKFLGALPSTTSEAARRVADCFHLDPAPWHRRAALPSPNLRLLAQAAWETRRLRLRYESWQSASVRIVEPLGIVLKAGDWYFLAHRRGQPAIHKLENVRDLTLLPETFERPAGFDLALAWREAVGRFETGLRRETAVLRVTPAALPRLDRLGPDAAAAVMSTAPDREGVREARVPIESIAQAAGQLLPFGDDIEALSPPALRQELARRAAATAALYAD